MISANQDLGNKAVNSLKRRMKKIKRRLKRREVAYLEHRIEYNGFSVVLFLSMSTYNVSFDVHHGAVMVW